MSTPNGVNEDAGLLESWHAHFKVPTVHQQAVDRLNFGAHRVAVHTFSDGAGRLLDFYAQLGSSDELFVSLHGAAPRGSFRYPMFRRVESMRNRVVSLLCFADPTLTCSEDEDFTIGWYVGGREWDPLDDIERAIRAAQEYTGARYVAFLGGSAGGHAALRIGTRFPGSLALVTDPQTDVGRYYVPHRDRMLRYCWNGSESALARHPDRFDMSHLYTTLDPENFIYYRQSTGDSWHEKIHARPFEESVAATTGFVDGRFRFVYEEGERVGHGKITPAEFDRHFDAAVSWWRGARPE